jgi:hypothetical protein
VSPIRDVLDARKLFIVLGIVSATTEKCIRRHARKQCIRVKSKSKSSALGL